MPTLDEVKLACARAAHEVNRIYCEALGDQSQVPWEQAPEWQRASCFAGVEGVLQGDGPGKSHDSWLAEKTAAGWKHGPVKDADKKEHPSIVPFDQLSAEEQMKDVLFVLTVRRMSKAFGMRLPDFTFGGHVKDVLDATYAVEENFKVSTRPA
jgi:hypothetical protein